MPRHENGPTFQIDRLAGQTIATLIGFAEAGRDEYVDVLFLRVDGEQGWHKLFLNAVSCIGSSLSDSVLSKFIIRTDRGDIPLSYMDANDITSPTRLSFEPAHDLR